MPHVSGDDKRLLHYWNQHLCYLISIASWRSRQNPFQTHLAPMMCDRGALQSTILSIAANHLALTTCDPMMLVQGYRHQQNAIRSLRKLIQSTDERDLEPAFATVMMMQISARLFASEDEGEKAVNHLLGAQAMITRRGSAGLWRTSSTAQFLLSLFAYHDILSSISRCTRTFVDHEEGFSAVEGVSSMQCLAKVLNVVARISELQDLAKISTQAAYNDLELAERFYSTGASIQRTLQHLDFTSPPTAHLAEITEDRDTRLIAEAYRHAAFVYLYRIWLGVGSPSPTTLPHVEALVAILRQLSPDSCTGSALIWPLFTGGCESIRIEDRRFARERLQEMYKSRLFPSLRRIARDMEDVWARKDREWVVCGDKGMEKVDCITVVREEWGREVDLA